MAISPLATNTSLWHVLPESLRLETYKNTPITAICMDSRQVTAGTLFIAVNGDTVDGRHYIGEAVARGCVAVLADSQCRENATAAVSDIQRQQLQSQKIPLVFCDNLPLKLSAIAARFYDYPAVQMTVLAVTGTNGKTTVVNMIAQLQGYVSAVNDTSDVPATIGTLGYGIASGIATKNSSEVTRKEATDKNVDIDTATLTDTGMTTPDAINLQGILAELRNAGATSVAVEVSSHSLSQYRVDAIGIKTAIFTNLSRDHLDYHGSMASYAKSKGRLFSLAGVQTVIINGDDPYGAQLLANIKAPMVCYRYGLTPEADVSASNVQLLPTGVTATITTPWGEGEVAMPLLGTFNIYNLLAAITAVCDQGADFKAVLTAVSKLTPVAGRMQVVSRNNDPLVIVDYAHTPDALEKSLQALAKHSSGKRWCVFGCGGNRDHGKRPAMAAMAEKWADQLVITSDNPRSEDPQQIINDMVAGCQQPQRARVIAHRKQAIQWAILNADQQDSILIAGKGHEKYQQIGSHKQPFDDVLIAKATLGERRLATIDRVESHQSIRGSL